MGTDEQIIQLQQKQKSNSIDTEDNNNKSQQQKYYKQRYYHRGAYYMDDDTLNNNNDDIINKAKIIQNTATGNDLLCDTSLLPKIKTQNKYFGFSGYSTKYKGLKMEDTTDKNIHFIPHVADSNKKDKVKK